MEKKSRLLVLVNGAFSRNKEIEKIIGLFSCNHDVEYVIDINKKHNGKLAANHLGLPYLEFAPIPPYLKDEVILEKVKDIFNSTHPTHVYVFSGGSVLTNTTQRLVLFAIGKTVGRVFDSDLNVVRKWE